MFGFRSIKVVKFLVFFWFEYFSLFYLFQLGGYNNFYYQGYKEKNQKKVYKIGGY